MADLKIRLTRLQALAVLSDVKCHEMSAETDYDARRWRQIIARLKKALEIQ
jgi:hypothetical protein